jgi:diguanylate cyclase (GGDEF)-like protein
VQSQTYFQLIGPLIFLVFSAGFAMIWRYARDSVPVRLFALAFFFGACATLADYLRDTMPLAVALYVLNLFYMATTLVFISALFHYYSRRVPWRFVVPVLAFWLAGLSWFILADDSVTARIIVMNAGSAAIIAYPAVMLRSRMSRPIDRILQMALAVIAVCIGARAGFVIVTGGGGLTNGNYANSMIALSLHFTMVLSALAVAIVLFIMVGMEIVNRLTETSETDPLTGVLNRRGLDARVAAMVNGDTNHVVVMADIDRFKAINDRYGHEAGDAVIRRFARILAGTARKGDLVVRWGGEEFLVVLADADTATARHFAEAVRTVFEEQAHDRLDGHKVTASFGIAAWDEGLSIAGVSHLADKALYSAKRKGRNRVCVFPRPARTPAAGKRCGLVGCQRVLPALFARRIRPS